MSLLDKMIKATSLKSSAVLSESKFFDDKEFINTGVPILNIAYSGLVEGGLTSGLTVIAGPSRHFKSNLGLVGVKSYLNKYPDAVCLFYDSEFGITPEYLTQNGVDASRMIHIPIMNIEELKFDIMQKFDAISRGDRVIIFVDSLGNLASKKEAEDALEGKSVADMSRAKQIKSLFRIITPHLTMKDIPCIVINHIYMTQEMYAKPVVSGGTGVMLSANTVFIIGRAQEKGSDGDLDGYKFTINIEKSRFIREKSKLPLTVTFEGGIDKFSGLLDLALEGKFVAKPSNGWYQKVDMETGELIGAKLREAQTHTDEFWSDILSSAKFSEFIKSRFKLGTVKVDDDIDTSYLDTEEE